MDTFWQAIKTRFAQLTIIQFMQNLGAKAVEEGNQYRFLSNCSHRQSCLQGGLEWLKVVTEKAAGNI